MTTGSAFDPHGAVLPAEGGLGSVSAARPVRAPGTPPATPPVAATPAGGAGPNASAGASTDAADDLRLVTLWRQGDARAFDDLYARHRDALWRYCLRQMGARTDARDRAAELFQDTWMKVIAQRDRWRPTGSFRAWLLTVAHNRLVDVYRAAGPAEWRQAGMEGLDGVADGTPGPDAETEHEQRARRLRLALDRLPPEQRQAFLLRQEAGLSLDDIAGVTGVGRETVKSRLRYALARLREELADALE